MFLKTVWGKRDESFLLLSKYNIFFRIKSVFKIKLDYNKEFCFADSPQNFIIKHSVWGNRKYYEYEFFCFCPNGIKPIILNLNTVGIIVNNQVTESYHRNIMKVLLK